MPAVTPGDYFEAGQELLAEGGVHAVTIANLCDRLRVTKGSFYHHFRNVEEFHDRLLDEWFTEHMGRRVAVADAATDPYERLETLRRFAIDRRHETEGAIRAWARSSPRAAEVQRRIDNNRIAHLVDVGLALGIDRSRAQVLAEMAVTMVAGSQNMCGPVDKAMVARLADEIVAQTLAAIPAERRR